VNSFGKVLQPLSGGDISEAWLIETGQGEKRVLKKAGSSTPPTLYSREAEGLKALRHAGGPKVPAVIDVGEDHILLEYIPSEEAHENFWKALGGQLASLHRSKVPQLGGEKDNFIGLTPQKNTPYRIYRKNEDWLDFFWEERIGFQLSLLKKQRRPPSELFRHFEAAKDAFFKRLSAAPEEPCLLHGDLWKGNVLCGHGQTPYLIDPAVSYGHREADLAMTQMFGGFHYLFFEHYQRTYPLKPGWPERFKIYQLYHWLNHWNLFGDAYAEPIRSILNQLGGYV
jgi:fructosamine-3-kinase